MNVSAEEMIAWAPRQPGCCCWALIKQRCWVVMLWLIPSALASARMDRRSMSSTQRSELSPFFSRQGEVREIYPANLPVRIHAALQTSGHWLIAGPDKSVHYRLCNGDHHSHTGPW